MAQHRTGIRMTGSFKFLAAMSMALFFALAAASSHASVTAKVDRTILNELDTLTLTLRAANDAADLTPDFSPLNANFQILSNQNNRQSSYSFVNGQMNASVFTEHVLTLKPKRQGNLILPAIRVGQFRSNPINIRVQQQSASQRAQMNRLVFFETSVDTSETWVQGQIIYTVKLLYTDGIGGNFPAPPVLDNTVVEALVNERRYEAVAQGRRYYVLEKRYAIFPQRSGTLTIPGETFVGVINNRRGNRNFSNRQQRVNATANPHVIQVKRIPPGFSGDHWIPAKSLTLKENWSIQPLVFRVGEPVNRQLTLSAVGVPESVLPPLNDMKAADAKIYADPPTTTQRPGNDGITAIQATTLGIVPTSEGEMTLPEIRIPWWNTRLDREEVAVIPASTWQVLPATGAAAVAPSVTLPITDIDQMAEPDQVTNPIWIYIAALLGLLWLASTWQWLALRRELRGLQRQKEEKYTAPLEDPDESRLFRSLMKACLQRQAAEAHRQLFLWGKARFPKINAVKDLADSNSPLAEAVAELEAWLFAEKSDKEARGDWDGSSLSAAATNLRQQPVEPDKLGKSGGDLAQALNPA